MSKYNNQYFFILQSLDKRLPILSPDDDTATKYYASSQLPIGEKPLIFYNGFLEDQLRNKIQPLETPPEILFDGSDILVKDKTREALLDLEISNLAIQPAIYIDHNDVRHEDYLFLTFLELFDCWDRNNSGFFEDEDDEYPMHEVIKYSLNDELLDNTPLTERKLFKIGATTTGFIVVHQSIMSLFKGTGAVLVPIAEYGVSYP